MWKKNRPCKAFVRSHICSLKTKRAKCVLLMPGSDAACLKELFHNGVVGAGTFVLALERDRKIADYIKFSIAGLARFGVNGSVFCGDLSELDLSNELSGRRIDFCYLDTCSELTDNIIEWLLHCEWRNFMPGLDCAISFCLGRRHPESFNKIHDWFVRMSDDLERFYCQGRYLDLHEVSEVMKFANERAIEDFGEAYGLISRRVVTTALTYGVALRCCFSSSLRSVILYRDKATWMGVYIFKMMNLRKSMCQIDAEHYFE